MSLKALPKNYLGLTDLEEDRSLYANIGISTRIRSGLLALMTLLHELIHTATPYKGSNHGGKFKEIAMAVGLRPPHSEVRNVTPELRVRLIEIRNQLGPYPQS